MIYIRKIIAYLSLLLLCTALNWSIEIERPEQIEKQEDKVKGYLYIATSPTDSDIYVDAEFLGKTSDKGGIFQLRSSKTVQLEREVSAGEESIKVSDISPFTVGDTVLISGIGKSETARIKKVTENGITLVNSLKNDYSVNAKVYRRRIVRIQKQFYHPKRIDVVILEGEITRIPFCTLSPGQTRALTIVSNPLKSYVYIDGELQYPLSHLITNTGNMVKYKCKDCGYIYNPEKGIPNSDIIPATPFEKLPNDWTCPLCESTKDEFEVLRDNSLIFQVKDTSPFELGEIVTVDDNDSKSIKAVIKNIDELHNIVALEADSGTIIGSNMFTAEQNGYVKSVSPFKTPCTLRNIVAGNYTLKLVSNDKKKVWQDEIELNVGQAELIEAELVEDSSAPVVGTQALLINNGDDKTAFRNVILSFNVSDETEVSEVLISNDGQSWTSKKYASQLKWELLPHPDEKIIQVKFRDVVGNETDIYSAKIMLIAPFGTQYIKEEPEEDSFYIDKFEVTNAQYKKFIDETGYEIPKHWNKEYSIYPTGTGDYPVVNVSWEDANNYAKWLGNRLQRECRIPTEKQWLKAAKGHIEAKWPWGDFWKGVITNFVDWQTGKGIASIYEFPQSRSQEYEIYNMAGNVWEWIAEPEDYAPSSAIQILAGESRKIQARHIRGGLEIGNANVATIDKSFKEVAINDEGYPGIGFRCIIPINPQSSSE